jgi:hypothetical protein
LTLALEIGLITVIRLGTSSFSSQVRSTLARIVLEAAKGLVTVNIHKWVLALFIAGGSWALNGSQLQAKETFPSNKEEVLAKVKEEQAHTNSEEDKVMVLATSGPITLGAGPVRIPLVSERTTPSTAGPERHEYIVLKNLSASKPPGVLYHLYLDLPVGTVPGKNDPHYIGTFNFFNSTNQSSYGASGSKTFFSYDVTARMNRLQGRQFTVTIFPGGNPSSQAKPTIGSLELVQQ